MNIGKANLFNSDVLLLYDKWDAPDVIVSDGAYGVSGFDGDVKNPSMLADWYEPHIDAWSKYSKSGTTLWFWNTEIGWASTHHVLSRYGWEYRRCNTWNKGLQHIAGNCNMQTLKGYPMVTEICVQYTRKPYVHTQYGNVLLKDWLRSEWERTGLPLYKANEACSTANMASRKYLTKDDQWIAPSVDTFLKLVQYANDNGDPNGLPYYSTDGSDIISRTDYNSIFPKFNGIYGVTNVWDCPPLHGSERVKVCGKPVHYNQKPLSLMELIVTSSSDVGDIVWEPFGGLFTVACASVNSGRTCYSAEISRSVFDVGYDRLLKYQPKERCK